MNGSFGSFKGIINIDSTKRQYGTINQFYYQLERPVEISEVCFVSIEFPNSFYNITSSNNVLTTSDGDATIASGFYNSTEIVSALQTALQSLDATYTVSYNAVNARITIARTGNFTITWSSGLARMLGFSSTQTLSGSASYTGDYVLNLTRVRDVYITCPQLPLKIVDVGAPRNTLFKLPLNTELGSYLYTDFNYALELTKPNTSISALDISLLDVDGNFLDPQGVEYSFSVLWR